MSAAKNWCFTLNNYTNDDLEMFDNLGSNTGKNASNILYFIIGKEVGESGTPHLQGFIQFRKKIRLNQVKNVVGRRANCSVMHRQSTPEFCARYCKKDDDWVEFGTIQNVRGLMSDRFYRIILAQ